MFFVAKYTFQSKRIDINLSSVEMCGRNAKNDNFPQSCSSAEMYIICALGKKYQWQLWDFFGSKKLRLQLSAEMYMWGQKWSMIPSFLGAKIAITTFRRIFGSKNNFPQKCICALGKKFGWLVKRGQTSFEQTRLRPEAQKPKTFRIAAFYAQNFSGRSARIHFLRHIKKRVIFSHDISKKCVTLSRH